MIKAIVVDDERLVRKGFISLFDWSSFGIAIVGEAADGRHALELLKQTEAELVFTDITMPGMSGFELIQLIRQCHPRVRSVVLTCHHEFDYVQEALRLGAIDYIVKTLLEPDNANDVMRRIVDRLGWDQHTQRDNARGVEKERIPADAGLLLYAYLPDADSNELFRLSIIKRNPLLELTGMWLIPLIHAVSEQELRRELALTLGRSWRSVKLTGLLDQPLDEIKQKLEQSMPLYVFYNYNSASAEGGACVGYAQLVQLAQLKAKQPSLVPSDGLELKWTLYSADWELFLRQVAEHYVLPDKLAQFGAELCTDWGRLLMTEKDVTYLQGEIDGLLSWEDWKVWLRRFSDTVQRRMLELGFSKEVMYCLIRAILFMKAEASVKLNQTDVADHVKMSRGYFSRCFAKFAGEPFGAMLRRMRIERAKQLLIESELPVYEISYLVGFEDDKYFSKLFRENVGQLPTEYRTAAARSTR
ncbi:response regulator transcription factor [Paenibacillus paridis]|uniref:response regulator transcription factor n=1 Tax=Paenibacillus paridis TaxID=2583376 RepID=UPI00111FE224|nr:response regulator [Paenibacillus paridis]